MARPKVRDAALAARLTTAAVAVVESGGVELATTRRVAHEAGTNIAALNQLFGSKDGLIESVILRGFDLLAAEALHQSAADLPTIGRGFRTFTRTHPHLTATMFGRPVSTSGATSDAGSGVRRCRAVLEAAIAALPGWSQAPRAKVSHAALGFTSLLEGLALRERAGILAPEIATRDRIWDEAVSTHLRGLVSTSPST